MKGSYLFMYNRSLRQKLLLSFIPPIRIKRFIDNQDFKELFEIKDKHVVVKKSIKLEDFTDYNVLSKFNNDKQIYSNLIKIDNDYNSKFKDYFDVTLDEYEKEKLK